MDNSTSNSELGDLEQWNGILVQPPPQMTETGAPTAVPHGPGRAHMDRIPAAERLIVALDMKDKDDALKLVDELGDEVSFYKVGMVRILDTGIDLVKELTQRGKKVFLDLKSFDIEETVASTVAVARDMGATFVTVHGSRGCIRAAKNQAGPDLKILAVTILTSLSRKDVYELYGIEQDLVDVAVGMAKFLSEAGCDGVIASPQEAARLRRELEPGVLIVTPGIRLDGTPTDDHRRAGAPAKAIADGADYLVVGRPIYEDDDPKAAAADYVAEISRGLAERGAGLTPPQI